MAYLAARAMHNTQLVQNLKTVNFVVRNVIMRNGTVLFVNTDKDPLLHRVTQHFARRAGQPYILDQWVGGTLSNFIATQRYYARRQHEVANFSSLPDLIFVSNVAENRGLFNEASSCMIPTVGIMHATQPNEDLIGRDPFVTYPLPTYAPKSLSTIYFCNKIISDVILHHRRKMASYALYSIPPASTTAASTLLSPYARMRLNTRPLDPEKLVRVSSAVPSDLRINPLTGKPFPTTPLGMLGREGERAAHSERAEREAVEKAIAEDEKYAEPSGESRRATLHGANAKEWLAGAKAPSAPTAYLRDLKKREEMMTRNQNKLKDLLATPTYSEAEALDSAAKDRHKRLAEIEAEEAAATKLAEILPLPNGKRRDEFPFISKS